MGSLPSFYLVSSTSLLICGAAGDDEGIDGIIF